MAMDLAAFRAAYVEFAEIDDTTVQSKLTLATSHIVPAAWGTTHVDEAVGLETAHLLWSSPFGATMRQDSGGELKKSRYQEQRERLAANVIDTSCVVTGCPRVR